MFSDDFPRLKIGISSGLLGNPFIDEALSKYFEVEIFSAPVELGTELRAYIFKATANSENEKVETILEKHVPQLPIIEESQLDDAQTRESFLTRVYRYDDWKKLELAGISAGALVNFQAEQKYLLMAYDQQRAKTLGRMVAGAGTSTDIRSLADEFIDLTMQVLKTIPNPKHHTNALHHIMGYLRKQIDSVAKQELLDCILSFENGEVTIEKPIRLLKHHFAIYPNAYIAKQRYLSPYPWELGLA